MYTSLSIFKGLDLSKMHCLIHILSINNSASPSYRFINQLVLPDYCLVEQILPPLCSCVSGCMDGANDRGRMPVTCHGSSICQFHLHSLWYHMDFWHYHDDDDCIHGVASVGRKTIGCTRSTTCSTASS